MSHRRFFGIALFFLVLFVPVLSRADTLANFNPSLVITDQELQNYNIWGVNDVQNFLQSKGSFLSTYQTPDANGVTRSAAQIIYNAAQTYQINPQFLVVTLQKEQSLITDPAPSQSQLNWATGYAVCDDCDVNSPSVAKFAGFGKQVDGAAGIMRWYYNNENNPVIKSVGVPIWIDNEQVVPQTWATSFLYTYTPHLHGNENFWNIWNAWFGQNYPNGSLLVDQEGNYWIIQNGQRRPFKNKTALITRYDPKTALPISDSMLNNYPVSTTIAFPNYALLATPTTTYLLDWDTLRPFATTNTVLAIGYNPQEIVSVSSSALAGYTIGTTITATTTNPLGIIFQVTDVQPNAYYLYKNGVISPLSKEVVNANYANLAIKKDRSNDLNVYTLGAPTTFSDGTLLQMPNTPTVYVMEYGKKRPIADNDTFNGMGYKRSNIVSVSLVTGLSIPTGDPLYLDTTLLSSKDAFLGDDSAPVSDLANETILPSYLIAEFPSGKIISGKNIDQIQPIASLTKLITSYEALNDGYSLTKTTKYSTTTYDNGGVNPLGIKTGDTVKNKDMLYAALVASENNAARFLAYNTGLSTSQFLDQANQRLAEWGANNTTITEVSGLDASDVSTARDLLKIFIKALENPNLENALSTKEYQLTVVSKGKTITHTLHNTNGIIWDVPLAKRDYSILATKTGFTDEASSTIAMVIQSKTTKQKYVIITLGDTDYANRFAEPNRLANWVSTASSSTLAGL